MHTLLGETPHRRRSGRVVALGSTAVLAAAGVGPLVMLTSSVASANTALVVSTLADSGAGSLRQAMLDANAAAGVDTIAFTAGLTGTIDVLSDLPRLTGGIDLQGPGASVITIDGGWTEAGGPSTGHALFMLDHLYIADGASTISGVTITGGNGTNNEDEGSGGAIQKFYGDANLTVADVVLSGNYAANDGGAINLYSVAGTIVIRDSVISNNMAAESGGALYFNHNGNAPLEISITDVSITGNSALYEGGGVYLQGASTSDQVMNVSMTRVTISGNDALEEAGGVYADFQSGQLTISDSTISNNTSVNEGGGLDLVATNTSIMNTTIDGNSSDGDGGGGIFSEDFYETSGSHLLTISNSTISGNHADWGGGLYATSAYFPVEIFNSTISGNSALSDGGGIYMGKGAGVTLTQSTVTNNSTGAAYDSIGGIDSGQNRTAPLALPAERNSALRTTNERETARHESRSRVLGSAPAVGGDLTLIGSIVAGNLGTDIGAYFNALPIMNASHSVLGVIEPAVTLVDRGGTQVGVTDPKLGLLANNGGVTKTHALLAGSPAIDAGPNPVPVFDGNEFDQRGVGFARIAFGVADAGAFEVQEPPATEPVVPSFTG